MPTPTFICDCGYQNKALNSRKLVITIQNHLWIDHHRWPSTVDIKLNPSKWGIRLIHFNPEAV